MRYPVLIALLSLSCGTPIDKDRVLAEKRAIEITDYLAPKIIGWSYISKIELRNYLEDQIYSAILESKNDP